MQALIDFAKAHPEVVTLLWASVLWPIVSGLGNKMLDVFVPRAEAAFIAFEQVHPRAAAVAKVLRKLGVDPHALFVRLRQILNGKPPPLPPGFLVTDGDAPRALVTQGAPISQAVSDALASRPPPPAPPVDQGSGT